MKGDRNQNMLLSLGGGAVSLLTAVVCFSSGQNRKSITRDSNDQKQSSNASVLERLAEIDKLQTSGVISQEEYAEARKKVLGEI
jgi:hypothetical protein